MRDNGLQLFKFILFDATENSFREYEYVEALHRIFLAVKNREEWLESPETHEFRAGRFFYMKVGLNISEDLLKSFYNNLVTLVNNLEYCGIYGGSIIYNPKIKDERTEDDERIIVTFGDGNHVAPEDEDDINLFEKSFTAYDNLDPPELTNKLWEKIKDVHKTWQYESLKYFGCVPFFVSVSPYQLLDRHYPCSSDLKTVLDTKLNARYFSEIRFQIEKEERRKDDELSEWHSANNPHNWDYEDDYTLEDDTPRMCEICRDTGSCLGIANCGFR